MLRHSHLALQAAGPHIQPAAAPLLQLAAPLECASLDWYFPSQLIAELQSQMALLESSCLSWTSLQISQHKTCLQCLSTVESTDLSYCALHQHLPCWHYAITSLHECSTQSSCHVSSNVITLLLGTQQNPAAQPIVGKIEREYDLQYEQQQDAAWQPATPA